MDYSVALNAANIFTGGVIVDGTDNTTVLMIDQENRLEGRCDQEMNQPRHF
ncbi:hypothetical protein CA13_55810 [Planctomycetes bacterium CA13]|uniref:Uncharacterized protein n=1 Tax=Novipirellula herctigrandis TaxID=2527986 RepID=A0A5C5ZAB3_9BACT|nr:hypothetical protein CA13_55810 [Planctomycetes bacterium CA13]